MQPNLVSFYCRPYSEAFMTIWISSADPMDDLGSWPPSFLHVGLVISSPYPSVWPRDNLRDFLLFLFTLGLVFTSRLLTPVVESGSSRERLPPTRFADSDCSLPVPVRFCVVGPHYLIYAPPTVHPSRPATISCSFKPMKTLRRHGLLSQRVQRTGTLNLLH